MRMPEKTSLTHFLRVEANSLTLVLALIRLRNTVKGLLLRHGKPRVASLGAFLDSLILRLLRFDLPKEALFRLLLHLLLHQFSL